MEKIIDIKDVIWKRQGKEILKNINWQVKKGENWAVLGLNGSGKTSLLNMVNGYIWPTSGKMSVLGREFGKTDIRELRKLIGWVSSSLQQRINEHEKTEYLVVSGKYASIGLYGEPKKRDFEEAFEWMRKLGCKHLIDKRYGQCSQGERQKLLIARGLMAHPELLILDEPTNGLDFLAREELLAVINDLARKEDAPTIILVTHHIEEVLPVFSHTLLLQDGRVFKEGRSENVLTDNVLSQFFKHDVKVNEQDKRFWMSLKDSIHS